MGSSRLWQLAFVTVALQLSGCIFFLDCGNGHTDVSTGEECDDGNLVDGDGCSKACVLEFCGDLVVQPAFEQCDDGNIISGDGCDTNCNIELTSCGDGTVDVGVEACDDGNLTDGDGCDSNCTITACGNGIVTAPEQCDDGNTIAGDGCDANCFQEICGDGFVDVGEGCDDGNTSNGDGCSFLCQVEGDVSFEYALTDSAGVSNSCIVADGAGGFTTVANVRFMIGNSLNGDAILDDNEIIQEDTIPCNQSVSLGLYLAPFSSGFFDLFAVEFLDASNNAIPWQTFDVFTNNTRFSFGNGVGLTIVPVTGVIIPFSGLNQTSAELQAFFGF